MPKKSGKPALPPLGNKFGKPDIERLGIFIEGSYMNGVRYIFPSITKKAFSFKGKNMLAGGRKTKDGTQQGYFDDKFRRLFEGEGINWKKPKEKKGKKSKVIGKPFMPIGPTKWHATPGDYYGCFCGLIEHFSNLQRKQPKYVHPKANLVMSRAKQGGPGYVDICLSEYPEHLADPYQPKPKKPPKSKGKSGPPMVTTIYPKPYFNENPYEDSKGKPGPTYIRPKPDKFPQKKAWVPIGPVKLQGGMHAGCFNIFPEWEPGKKPKPQKKVKTSAFYPQSMAIKTMFTAPIIFKSVDSSVTAQNYANFEPTYVKYLLN